MPTALSVRTPEEVPHMTTGDGGASRVVQVTRISVGSEVNAKRVYMG